MPFRSVTESSEYTQWFSTLSEKQKAAVLLRVHWLLAYGPTAGRPYVDTITHTSISNLKELRVSSQGHIRILFIFSPQRDVFLLVGGDKSMDSRWNRWYNSAIALAEEILARNETHP